MTAGKILRRYLQGCHPGAYVAGMSTRTTTKRTTDQPDELLTTEAVAARIGLSPITLKIWRWQQNPHAPPHITVGARGIRYSAAAIEHWKASRTTQPGTTARSKDRSPGRHRKRPGPR